MSCVSCMSLITAILQLKAGQAYGFSFNTSSIRFSDFWNRQFWSPVFIVFTPFNSRQSRMLTMSPSCPWSVDTSSKLPLTINPSNVHFNLGLGLIKNACSPGYTAKRGGGCTSNKKTRPNFDVVETSYSDVLQTSAIDVVQTSYTDVLHDVVTTSWGVHASAHDVVGTSAWRRHDVVKTSNFLTGVCVCVCVWTTCPSWNGRWKK